MLDCCKSSQNPRLAKRRFDGVLLGLAQQLEGGIDEVSEVRFSLVVHIIPDGN